MPSASALDAKLGPRCFGTAHDNGRFRAYLPPQKEVLSRTGPSLLSAVQRAPIINRQPTTPFKCDKEHVKAQQCFDVACRVTPGGPAPRSKKNKGSDLTQTPRRRLWAMGPGTRLFCLNCAPGGQGEIRTAPIDNEHVEAFTHKRPPA